MTRARLALSAILATAAIACSFDPTAARTTRDLEEIGRADLGEIQADLEPGVAIGIDAAALRVRFRANAPSVTLTLRSTASEARSVRVELANVFPDVQTEPALPIEALGPKAIAIDVTVSAGGEARVLVSRPQAALAQPFRFAWVGDVQGGYERFARIRERINADPSIDFVVFGGDDTDNGQADQVAEFVSAADALEAPWYTLIGNHEAMGDEEGFQRAVGRINLAFHYKGARLVLLDSASGTIDERIYRRMDEWLGKDGPALRIVAMHLPPFDAQGLRDGGFNSRTEGAKAMSRLAAGGADLLLCGHLHTLLFSESAGVPTVVSGGGGVDFGMRMDGSDLHYLAIDADPARSSVVVGVAEVP